jgi:hypothetical protein
MWGRKGVSGKYALSVQLCYKPKIPFKNEFYLKEKK